MTLLISYLWKADENNMCMKAGGGRVFTYVPLIC